MSSAGRRLLSSLVRIGSTEQVLKLELRPVFFNDLEIGFFKFLTNHVLSYGAVPTADTVEEKVGDVLVDCPEPPEYYLAELEKRHIQTVLKRAVNEAQSMLKDQDPEKAFELLISQLSELDTLNRRKSLVDFKEMADDIYLEYKKTHIGEELSSVLFGWPTLDNKTGGLRGGDVCSIIGRPASGKTFMELYIANKHWLSGGVPLFVSMEMTVLSIGQRIAAMSAKKQLTHLLKGALSSTGLSVLMKTLSLHKEKTNSFWLVDGNLAVTVEDVVMLCRQLKPSVVFVDGAYLLRSNNPKLGRWDRMTETAEGIKQRVATDLKLPVVNSYQFSREVAKKKGKKNEQAGLDDIYGSDSIGQLATIALGLFEEDTVETEKRRRIDLLKGRNGESGSWLINWDFNQMNFDEVVKETSKLQFLG